MENLIKATIALSMLTLCSCSRVVHTNERLFNHSNIVPAAYLNDGVQPAKMIDASNRRIEGNYDTKLDFESSYATPLPNGFAHNDYCHQHPLYDALNNGFTNIEADIFLLNNKLIVAHFFPYFKNSRTLESLYLAPLMERITKNNGRVFPGYIRPVTFMIDIKTNAEDTYKALKPLLEKYRTILSGYEDGKMIYRAVTIVLSGHKPFGMIKNEQNRLAFIDKNLCEVPCDPTNNNNVFEMASCKYSDLLKWDGTGVIPKIEKDRLCMFVTLAHKMRTKVRLWAAPETKEAWDELLNCGVDMINTDQLVVFKNYSNVRTLVNASLNQDDLMNTD